MIVYLVTVLRLHSRRLSASLTDHLYLFSRLVLQPLLLVGGNFFFRCRAQHAYSRRRVPNVLECHCAAVVADTTSVITLRPIFAAALGVLHHMSPIPEQLYCPITGLA